MVRSEITNTEWLFFVKWQPIEAIDQLVKVTIMYLKVEKAPMSFISWLRFSIGVPGVTFADRDFCLKK